MDSKIRSPGWFWALCLIVGCLFKLPPALKRASKPFHGRQPGACRRAQWEDKVHFHNRHFPRIASGSEIVSRVSFKDHAQHFFPPLYPLLPAISLRTALCVGKSTALCSSPPQTAVALCSCVPGRSPGDSEGCQDQQRELPSFQLPAAGKRYGHLRSAVRPRSG